MREKMRFSSLIAGLLLICFSAYLGHNLVPHHHHAEVYQSPIASDCPFEHGDHQGHDHEHDASSPEEGHPVHCHAFNDVVFKKYNAPALHPWACGMQLMTNPGLTRVPEQTPCLSPHGFTGFKPACRAAIFPGSRDLRAPPVFA